MDDICCLCFRDGNVHVFQDVPYVTQLVGDPFVKWDLQQVTHDCGSGEAVSVVHDCLRLFDREDAWNTTVD